MLSQCLKLSKALLGAFLVIGLTLSFNAHANLAKIDAEQELYWKLTKQHRKLVDQTSRALIRSEKMREKLETLRERLKNERSQVRAAQEQKAKAQKANNNTEVQRYHQLVKKHQEAAKKMSERFKVLREKTLKAEAKYKRLNKRLTKKADQIHLLSREAAAEASAGPAEDPDGSASFVAPGYVPPDYGDRFIPLEQPLPLHQ